MAGPRRVESCSPCGIICFGRGLCARTARIDDVDRRRRLGGLIVVVAVVVAVVGLVDLAFISLQAWRGFRCARLVPRAARAGLRGLSGPSRTGCTTRRRNNPIRRLVSTFLSARERLRPRRRAGLLAPAASLVAWPARAAPLRCAPLHYTRAALSALVVDSSLAVGQRRVAPAVLALASVAAERCSWLPTHRSVHPSYTKEELEWLAERAARPWGERRSVAGNEPRRQAISATCEMDLVVVRHPQGYGLGNAGVAKRTGSRSEQASRPTFRRGCRRRESLRSSSGACPPRRALAKRPGSPHSPLCSSSGYRPTSSESTGSPSHLVRGGAGSRVTALSRRVSSDDLAEARPLNTSL